jgi:hypothetical protein
VRWVGVEVHEPDPRRKTSSNEAAGMVTRGPPPAVEAAAQEQGRVKWKRPTQAEADRMASESAITDSILRKGDIVVTDRGFFMFRGFLADGATADFVPVPNPLPKR